MITNDEAISTEEADVLKSVIVAFVLSVRASIALPSYAAAQVAQSGYTLPLDLALEGATTAVHACEAKGWLVSAFVWILPVSLR